MLISYQSSMGLSTEAAAPRVELLTGQLSEVVDLAETWDHGVESHALRSPIPCCRFPSCTLCSLGVVIVHQLSRNAGASLGPPSPSLLFFFFFFPIKLLFSEEANNFPKTGGDRGLKLSETDLYMTLHAASHVCSGIKSYTAKYGESPGVIHLSALISGLPAQTVICS